MSAKDRFLAVAMIAFGAIAASGQTRLDLRTQTKNVDFTAAASTSPVKTGTALPSLCTPGAAYFLMSAGPGQNLYLCTDINSWSVQGGASSGTTIDLGPSVTLGSSTRLLIGGNCSLTSPCHARTGSVTYTYQDGGVYVDLTSGSPTARIYISDGSDGAAAGTIQVRNSAASGLTCSAGCTVSNGQTSFPGASIPLAIWTATNAGAWDATGSDLRSALSTTPEPSAGLGILITQGAGTTVSVDSTVVPQKFSGAGSPGNVSSSSLGDFYVDTQNVETYQCFNPGGACNGTAQGNWVKVVSSSSSGGSGINTSTLSKKFDGIGAPGVVVGSTIGDLYLDTANSKIYLCFNPLTCTAVAAGNWVQSGSGTGSGSTGPTTTIDGVYAVSNGSNYFAVHQVNGLPDAATFTWLNQPAGATDTIVGSHARHVFVPGPGSNGDNLAVRVDANTLSPTSFTLTGSLVGCSANTSVNNSLCGIGITDGTKIVTFGWMSVYGGIGLAVAGWSNATTLSAIAANKYWPLFNQITSMRISLSGGTLTFLVSLDGGASYDPIYSTPVTSFFSSANGLNGCWAVNNNWTNGIGSSTLVDWNIR